jgi:predicted O-linked N-acetylglucosamine transferase (SPINDLY family)
VDLLQTLVVAQEYTDSVTPEGRMAATKALARVLAPAAPPRPRPDHPDRPLRVAYLSPDFREHSVAYFFESVLAQRDDRIRHACYALAPGADALTARLRAAADEWCDAAGLTDESLAARLRADRTDILVDLAGFTAGGRPGLLARRIAPVQINYLGWAATTGLPTMDWRLVDSHTDPAGAEAFATERLFRLDPCFLCYRPPEQAPLPAPREGPVCFGSFNALAKVSPGVIAAWSELLGRVPGSRLLLKAGALSDPATAALTRGAFERAGVEPSRLEVLPWASGVAAHLQEYRRVDIALDPFPYNGTTTTCEALWMGVPAVTLVGRSHAGRVGVSLLSNTGLPDLIARDPSEYVSIAAALAADPARRAALRSGLREHMKPLCDAPAFARRLAGALREIWIAACAGR